MDMDLIVTYQSPSSEKLRGFTFQELRDLPLEKNLAPESLKLGFEALYRELPRIEADPGYNPVTVLDLEYYRKDGTTVWLESKFSIIRDVSGKPVSLLLEAREITERRKAEAVLRESEERFRNMANLLPLVVFEIDEKGNFTFANRQGFELFGYSEADVAAGLSVLETLIPQDRDRAVENISRHISGESFPSQEYAAVRKDGSKFPVAIYASPIITNSKYAGMRGIMIDLTERRIAEEKLVKSYESVKKTLNDAINTIVKIVETRDPYTAGHQHKVADLAVAIAMEMQFDDIQIDQLKTAAVIHDIGKMYVPSDILSKPGKLSDMEFSLIKTHAQAGFDIIKGMDFPGAIAETVLQHHERLDGSGYPHGLKGEDTLMKAKILAVADVVEAMASHRPYRPALGIDKALEEISKNKGKLYDPAVVDACLKLFQKEGFKFIECGMQDVF
jgi:PAS domain S-box-containing protein/putative nucleotidyltransferase with HDIG domain